MLLNLPFQMDDKAKSNIFGNCVIAVSTAVEKSGLEFYYSYYWFLGRSTTHRPTLWEACNS